MDKYANKDFSSWNLLKKKIEKRNPVYCSQREVWWCSLGENVGSEECGKNNLFERPVLILKVFSRNLVIAAPITSRPKKDVFHQPIYFAKKLGWVIVSQVKVISTKRLYRKIDTIEAGSYETALRKYIKLLTR